MDNMKFCTQCGAEISESDVFCPKCGHKIGGPSEGTAAYEDGRKQMVAENSKNAIIAIVILCALWAIVSIYEGISAVISLDYVIEVLKSDTSTWDMLMEILTEQDIRNIISSTGYVMMASGILAALTAVFTGVKRYYPVALWTCILSSVLGLICIFGIFGFIVVYLITKNKEAFTN